MTKAELVKELITTIPKWTFNGVGIISNNADGELIFFADFVTALNQIAEHDHAVYEQTQPTEVETDYHPHDGC